MNSVNWGGVDAIDPRFLSIVKDWIETDGEIYVRIYHAKAGGCADHWLFNSYATFVKTINSTWGDCGIEVYRHPSFPVRGVVCEELIARAKDELDEGRDWFLVGLEEEDGGWKTLGAFGNRGYQVLEEELRKYQGKFVIIGPDIHLPFPPDDYPGEWIYGNFDRVVRMDEIPAI